MEKYDYRAHEVRDILDYIEENNIEITKENREEVAEQLRESLWDYDSVTGNGSGSYTFNRHEAERNLCHNFGLLAAALECFGDTRSAIDLIKAGAEVADVTIRCYLLDECIEDAIDIAIKKREKYDC